MITSNRISALMELLLEMDLKCRISIKPTVGGEGLAFFDNGSSSSDSFSPLLSSFSGFVEAAARFERCGVVLLFALFFVGAFRLGDSCFAK